ncbi:hypothetical protein [Vacuolonema iberomarrocanum]|uniref:hypothetical protein n=1 Tax=Vacuolonema iberomarrocanum TaxID=3454632 RepID=UPI001A005B69|nr:hypothetical protein [filamentous cyanobacterium LEGE 07170]
MTQPPTDPSEPNVNESNADRGGASAEIPIPKGVEGRQKSTLTRLTIRLLRSLIRILEWMVAVLEADPQPGESANPIVRGAQRATTAVAPVAQRTWTGWQTQAIPKIRAALPLALGDRLSDRTLTSLLAGTLVLLFVVLPNFAPRGAASEEIQVSEVPTRLEQPEVEAPVTPSPPPPPDAEIAIAEPPPASASPDSDTQEIEPADEAETDLPPPSPSPSPPSSSRRSSPTPSPTPAPKLALTPEQTLIASIQERISLVSDRYTNGLILTVRANFRQSILTVRLGDEWYGLSTAQQDDLANDLLRQATRLDFSKLELTDSVGNRLARNPVVGNQMIILRREKPPGFSIEIVG